MKVAIGIVIGVPLRMAAYAVGTNQWEKAWEFSETDPRPVPAGEDASLVGPVVFGVGAALVTLVVFGLLGVRESEYVRALSDMVAEGSSFGRALLYPASLLAVIAAAIVEEIVFRGVLLGWLVALFRERRGPTNFAIVLSAGIWALGHLANTDSPALKVAQVFIIGLVLGEFARRRGLKAAIAGHVSLNIVAATLEMALF